MNLGAGLSERLHGLDTKAGMANAGPARRARRRRRDQWRTKKVSQLERQVKRLEEMLRNQPGIHVRIPSHIHPPFRAIGFSFESLNISCLAALGIAGEITLGAVPFLGGALVVPDGYQGVVSLCDVTGSFSRDEPIGATVAFDPRQDVLWSLRKNGTRVPGYTDRRIRNLMTYENVGGGVRKESSSTGLWPAVASPVLPPVHLVPGDGLEVFGIRGIAAGRDVEMQARVFGWIYPVRQSAPGILGTVVD